MSLICTVFKLCCPAHLFPNTPRKCEREHDYSLFELILLQARQGQRTNQEGPLSFVLFESPFTLVQQSADATPLQSLWMWQTEGRYWTLDTRLENRKQTTEIIYDDVCLLFFFLHLE